MGGEVCNNLDQGIQLREKLSCMTMGTSSSLDWCTVRGVESLLLPAHLVRLERWVEATPLDFLTLALAGAIVKIKVEVKREKNPRC